MDIYHYILCGVSSRLTLHQQKSIIKNSTMPSPKSHPIVMIDDMGKFKAKRTLPHHLKHRETMFMEIKNSGTEHIVVIAEPASLGINIKNIFEAVEIILESGSKIWDCQTSQFYSADTEALKLAEFIVRANLSMARNEILRNNAIRGHTP